MNVYELESNSEEEDDPGTPKSNTQVILSDLEEEDGSAPVHPCKITFLRKVLQLISGNSITGRVKIV